MKIAVMQPYAFPYLGYFQLIEAVDRFVILDDAQFIKGGWINRNIILGSDRQPWRFTIPLSGASQNKRIHDIDIAPDPAWRQKLLMTIGRSYRKTPNFAEAWPLIESLIADSHGNLVDFIMKTLRALNRHLGITTPILKSSDYGNGGLSGEARILDICRRENATCYLNLPGGRELYLAEAFEKQGIYLRFLDHQPIPYPQFQLPFIARLSIIDSIFFNDIPALRQQLTGYCLGGGDAPTP